MYIGLLFTFVIALVLYGLISSTEKVLALRQQRWEKGERQVERRSRM